jgi:hypothetical protein
LCPDTPSLDEDKFTVKIVGFVRIANGWTVYAVESNPRAPEDDLPELGILAYSRSSIYDYKPEDFTAVKYAVDGGEFSPSASYGKGHQVIYTFEQGPADARTRTNQAGVAHCITFYFMHQGNHQDWSAFYDYVDPGSAFSDNSGNDDIKKAAPAQWISICFEGIAV